MRWGQIGNGVVVATLLIGGLSSTGHRGLLAASARPASRPAAKSPVPLEAVRLRDASGKGWTLDDFRSSSVLVLVFTGVDCPVSNSYTETLSALQNRYRDRGVRLLAIDANPDESLAAIGRNAADFPRPFPFLRDDAQLLADALGARVTPEAFVLDRTRAVRYHGRIDDSYASRTVKRKSAAHHELADAIDAVLADRPVAVAAAPAIGCSIVRTRKPVTRASVTYYRDVAPIVQQRCQGCHRPGQVAPFSLLTYADARRWAREMKELTVSRQMPPWLAEPGHGDFQDVRRLSDREVQVLSSWADAGAPAGNPHDAPAPRSWPADWALGKPDLVLTPTDSYTVSGTGDDEFRVFVLPTGLSEDKQVVAIDFRPGNSRVVHHVVSFVDTTGKGRELDARDPGPGYNSGPGGVKVPGAAIQGVWAPGNLPRFLPKGVGRPLPRNSDLLIQVHYHKTGKPETDRTQVALYFAREPVKKVAHTAIVGSFRINIPENDPRHEEKFSMVLPTDVSVLNIMPHMHLLGKEMRVSATFPGGKTEDLVWIKNWDYRWQDSYRYEKPLFLPRGTKVEVTTYYDNSTANPRNPSIPPRRVRFGEQTTDEMGFAIMEIVVGAVP